MVCFLPAVRRSAIPSQVDRMTPLVFWLALACGVDAGYEPAPDGHLEYIIQIEPELVGKLASGHDMISEVPRGLDIRHYRVTIGTALLPKNAAARSGGADGGTGHAADQFEVPGRSDRSHRFDHTAVPCRIQGWSGCHRNRSGLAGRPERA